MNRKVTGKESLPLKDLMRSGHVERLRVNSSSGWDCMVEEWLVKMDSTSSKVKVRGSDDSIRKSAGSSWARRLRSARTL